MNTILIIGAIAIAIVIALYILERKFPNAIKWLPESNSWDTAFPSCDEEDADETT